MPGSNSIACKVRPGFYVHLKNAGVHKGGSPLNLSPEEYQKHKHQVEISGGSSRTKKAAGTE